MGSFRRPPPSTLLEEGRREKKIIESVAPATGTALLFLQE
jgi:hypothetical protein